MRKQNSKFKTSFLSEEGTELRNLDCFSYIELSDFACYVLSDGLPGPSKRDPGRMAAEEILSRPRRPARSGRFALIFREPMRAFGRRERRGRRPLSFLSLRITGAFIMPVREMSGFVSIETERLY